MTIKVTYQTLHDASGTVRRIDTNLHNHLDELKTHIDRVASGWDGQAKEDYMVVQGNWNGNVSALQEILTKIASTLDEIATLYQETENANARAWHG